MRRVIAAFCAALVIAIGLGTTSAAPVHAAFMVDVTFIGNGGTTPVPHALQLPAGRSIADEGWVLPHTSRAGYALTGWSPTPEGNGETYDATTPILRDTVLYAQWSPKAPVTVTFAGNRGCAPSQRTLTVLKGQPVGMAGELPRTVRDGFVFVGWNTAANGTGDAFTASSVVSEDMLVYAQWAQEDSEELANRLDARTDAGLISPQVIVSSQVIWRQVGSYHRDVWVAVREGDGKDAGFIGQVAVPAGAHFAVVTSSDPVHAPSCNVAEAEAEAKRLAELYGGQVGSTVQGMAWRGQARIIAIW